MSNIRVTHETDLNNARSESSLAINPNNTQQIVAGSKRFIPVPPGPAAPPDGTGDL